MYTELYHHGIKGQRWGVRRFQNEDGSLTERGKKKYGHLYDETGTKLKPLDTDSSVTKRVKQHYNEMSDADFRKKYGVKKEEYVKRVAKYGDPYKNSPYAKAGRKQLAKEIQKKQKSIDALNKDIASFDGHESGIYTKRGKMALSAEDVNKSVSALKAQRDKYQKQVDNALRREGLTLDELLNS